MSTKTTMKADFHL